MELRKILPGNPDIEKIGRINLEAFPDEERMDLDWQLGFCADGKLDLLGIYDDGLLVGFTTVFPSEGMDYVFFLAMDPSVRSRGYGARTLELVRQRYSGDCIVLDIEPLSPEEPGAELRSRRRGFYLRNGFRPSGCLLTYLGLAFEVLYCGDGDFDRGAYVSVLEGVREMLSTRGIDKFRPVLRDISLDGTLPAGA